MYLIPLNLTCKNVYEDKFCYVYPITKYIFFKKGLMIEMNDYTECEGTMTEEKIFTRCVARNGAKSPLMFFTCLSTCKTFVTGFHFLFSKSQCMARIVK